MGKQKIPCGGFYIDNKTLKIEDGVLKAVGGEQHSYMIAEEQDALCEENKGFHIINLVPTDIASDILEGITVLFSIEGVYYSGEVVFDDGIGWHVISGNGLEQFVELIYQTDDDKLFIIDQNYAGTEVGEYYTVEVYVPEEQPMPSTRFDVIFTPQAGINNYAINQSFYDIVEAFENGDTINAFINGVNGLVFFELNEMSENSMLFSHLEFDTEHVLMIYHYFTLSSDNQLSYNYITYKLEEPIS